ncbi:MAG: peptidylprolyl isomerase, partial [Comamonadaceae bacterium 32-67-11]
MNDLTEATRTGCGGGGGDCQCAAQAAEAAAATAPPLPRINGVALQRADEALSPPELRERAYAELLRQEAVRRGLLPAAEHTDLAPTLDEAQQECIQAMLEAEVQTPEPNLEACERTYQAQSLQFVVGQAVNLRHILFAVTPGVNVHALAQRAETALLELSRKEAAPQRFGELARELSNCPSGAQGGELGWIGPDDCAPELANELFFQTDQLGGMGLHPRLVHTRFGFHIVEVLG